MSEQTMNQDAGGRDVVHPAPLQIWVGADGQPVSVVYVDDELEAVAWCSVVLGEPLEGPDGEMVIPFEELGQGVYPLNQWFDEFVYSPERTATLFSLDGENGEDDETAEGDGPEDDLGYEWGEEELRTKG